MLRRNKDQSKSIFKGFTTSGHHFFKRGYQTLKTIYYAFFHSIINYGIIAWGGDCDNNIKMIQKAQNRILKIISKNKFIENIPMNLKQLFASESLLYN